MSKLDAQNEAVRIAVAKLADVDLRSRSEQLGFQFGEPDTLQLHVFGADCVIDRHRYEVRKLKTGELVKPEVRLLVLHYLLSAGTPAVSGELISFRELPGGQFYEKPFQSRSVNILTARIKNDVELLKKNLDRFEWCEVAHGDFAARIRTLGNLHVTLVYYRGDDEMPATADVLFDPSIRKVFSTEDVVVLASLTCRGLL